MRPLTCRYFSINMYYSTTGLQLVEQGCGTADTEADCKVIHGFSTVVGTVGAPNPCVVQGSAVFGSKDIYDENKKQRNDSHKIQDGGYFRRQKGNTIREEHIRSFWTR